MARSTAPSTRAGTLYVVATPIGNLEDITLRALRVLKTVDLIAAEDTRRTAILLRHYDISTPVLSVHEHNERRRSATIIGRLAAGDAVALVSDAGTPAISDPGSELLAAVREAGFRIEPIPGASAVMAALSASGIAAEGFTFLGFPPVRSKARTKWLEAAAADSSLRTVVIFEAPHRIKETLLSLGKLVTRPIIACRELTKLHEEIRAGSPSDLATHFASPKGEFTVVIPHEPVEAEPAEEPTDAEISAEFGHMAINSGLTTKGAAIRKVAEKLGLSRRAVYAALERAKIG